MKRTAGVMLLLTALGGCTGTGDHSPWTPERSNGPHVVPGVQGPWGTPVPTIGPSPSSPPGVGLTQNTTKPGAPLDLTPCPSSAAQHTATAAAPSPPAVNSGIVSAGGIMLPSGSAVARAAGSSTSGAPSGVVQAS